MFKQIITSLTLLTALQAQANNSQLSADNMTESLAIKAQNSLQANHERLMQKHDIKGISTVATIGGDGGCDFNSSIRTTPIQDAIDWAPVTYTELRIVEGTYDEENITLNDRSMVIRGGFASCADAENNIMTSPDSTNTIIQSSTDNNPVFRIQGNGFINEVNFFNLSIRNSGSTNWFGGAFRISDAAANVFMEHVSITDNTGLKGGALAVTGTTGNTLLSLEQVQIAGNNAEEGGGIYCSNPTGSIFYGSSDGESHGIYGNSATAGNGGGVLIENGCNFTNYQGSKDVQLFGSDYRGINYNTATGSGGGLAVLGGGKAYLYGRNACAPVLNFWLCIYGNNDEPVTMAFNQADNDDLDGGDGGAIFVSGTDSHVLAENVYIIANFADNGGALAATEQATAIVATAFENEAGNIGCWQPGACVDVTTNFANTAGGAFYAASNAEVQVNNARITANRAISGVAGYARDNGTVLGFEGALMYNNGDNGSGDYNDTYLLRSFLGSELKMHFSTVADNFVTSRQIGNNDARVAIGSSIIHDPSGVDIYTVSGNNNPTQFMDCLLTHESSTLIATRVLVTDPEFVDRGNGNYLLSDTSSAIDYCDTAWVTPTVLDLQGEDRGQNAPDIADNHGTYDLGAYENVTNDIIFKNGFE